MGRGGESTVMDNLLEHINTRITDEGLVIELFALEGAPLFDAGSDQPTSLMTDLTELVGSVIATAKNDVAIGGHVRSQPIVLARNPVWDISAQRGTRTRLMLEENGVDATRMMRVTGHADRETIHPNPMAERNDRVEIVLLRE